ncbi:hypothetical protein BDW59DRAFT_177191 [Aspergillus cavernicola]|uniref:RING-type domain-containing protein n=1 Tax=Aspergillus cavernicola TaxID=176166 RepID=A0ABR4J4X4_9EURO
MDFFTYAPGLPRFKAESDKTKGKQKAGMLTDLEVALEEWSGELHQTSTVLQDHTMALSMARAVLEDGVALTVVAQEESRELADRHLAFRLAGQQPPEPRFHIDEQNESLLESYPNKRRCMAESSKTAASRQLVDVVRSESVACTETKPDMLQAQCPHWYCKDCIIRLVTDALVDQSLFPPGCCRVPIPLSSLRRHLGMELSKCFEEKDIEHRDPYKTYCSNPGYMGTCQTCQARTCTLCKQPAHDGVCGDTDKEVMKLAEQSGWQQCAQCHHLIELSTGCNHIICRCKYQFCYICRRKWKSCRCETWDENRHYDRAHILAAQCTGPPGQQDVHAVAERMRDEEEGCCHWSHWRRIDGNGVEELECELCGDMLFEFILECRHCQLFRGIFSKGKTSSPVKCCVVDQRFSETDFLSKLSAHEPVDTLRHSSGVNMFDYDAEIGHSCQSNNQLGVELLESNVEENHQQLPLSPMIGLIQDGTDMCHGSNNRHDSKANATFAPFRRPLNQSSRGEEQKAHYESLNACPRAEQTCFPFADPAYQYYTMQLLNFDLHTTEQSVARGPAEKYWTLEELKHLLQQRTSLRSPYEKGSLVTSTPQLQKCPRKRKHSPTEDSDTINAEPSRKSRVREPSQISDDSLRGTSTSPRTTLLGLYWFPGGFVDAPLNKRSIAHGDISDGTGGSSFQPQRPCRDRGASVLYDKDTSLISQTFDAAYEAIMRSERTEPHILPDYLPMENDSASWKWGTETLSPTHIGKEILSSQSEERELAYNTTGTNHQAQQPLDLEGLYADRQSRISVERDFVLGLGEAAGWNGPEATGLALDISPMRNFWRQNKLY